MIPVIWVTLSVIVGLLGRDRAFGFWFFFICSLLLSPILMLLVLLLSALTERKRRARVPNRP